jgi:hypothetical protein
MSASIESPEGERAIPPLPVTLQMGDNVVIRSEDGNVYDGFVATPQEPDFSCKVELNGIQRTLEIDVNTQEVYLEISEGEFVRAEAFEVRDD